MISNNRAVSSTISVALLLALCIVLAVALAFLSMTLTDFLNGSAQASVNIDQDNEEVQISIVSLQQEENTDFIYIRATNASASGGVLSSAETHPAGPSDSSYYLYATGDGGVGTKVTLDMSAAESQTIYIVGVNGESENIIREYQYTST